MIKQLYLITCFFLTSWAMAQNKSKAAPELIGEWRSFQATPFYKVLVFDSSQNVLFIKTSVDSTIRYTSTFANNILTLTDGMKAYTNKVLHLTEEGQLIFANFLTADGVQTYNRIVRKQVTFQ